MTIVTLLNLVFFQYNIVETTPKNPRPESEEYKELPLLPIKPGITLNRNKLPSLSWLHASIHVLCLQWGLAQVYTLKGNTLLPFGGLTKAIRRNTNISVNLEVVKDDHFSTQQPFFLKKISTFLYRLYFKFIPISLEREIYIEREKERLGSITIHTHTRVRAHAHTRTLGSITIDTNTRAQYI